MVTVQKREENLQTVPVSVTAFSGDQVKKLGFQNQTQIIGQSAGITLNDFGASPVVRIRGVGPETFSETVESSAAIYRDEVYRPTMAANSAQLFDVARVEVLRGPQGTLYGRNTNAGLMHFYSERPTDELEGYGEVQVGNFGQLIAEGAVSGPLADNVRGRLAIKSNKDDGYQENLGSGGGDDFGATDVLAVRGQLEFDLNENLNLRLIASDSRQRSTSQIYGFRGLVANDGFAPCGPSQVLAEDCFSAAPTPTGVFQVADLNAEEGYSELSDLKNDIDAQDLSVTLKWQLNDTLEFISISAYETIDRHYEEDIDATDFGLFFGFDPVSGAPLFFQAAATYVMDAKTLSQEFRLVGSTESLNWVAGLYYFDDEKTDVNNSIVDFGIDVRADVTTESTAAFAQAEYSVTDTLTLTTGLRYTDDERNADVATPLAPFVILGSVDAAEFDAGDGKWTYKLGLQWDVSEDLMLYASHSTGVKSGEFNVNLITSADQAAPVGEEKITAYEVGAKWTFLDGLGRLNASLFYNDIEDYQATVYEAPPGGGLATAFFRNIGDVDVSGAEIELFVAPMENLDLMLAVSLLDSEVDSNEQIIQGPLLPPTFAGGTVYSVDGNELVQAPEVSLNGIVRYAIPTDAMGEFSLQVDFTWQDDVFLDVANDPYNVQEAYTLWNARISWESPEEFYYAQLFVENAADKFFASEAYTPEGFDRQGVIFGKPRTYGAKFGVRF